MSKLLIIENISPQLVNFVRAKYKDADLLLVSPEALITFKDSGLKVHYPEDFISSKELNQLGMDNFERARVFVSIIDDFLREKFPFLKEGGFKFAFYHIDRFKIFMDSVISRIYILYEVISRLNPTEIYYAAEENKNFRDILFLTESVYSFLVPIIVNHFHIPIKCYPFSVPYRNYSRARLSKVTPGRLFDKISLRINNFLENLNMIPMSNSNERHKVLSIDPQGDLNKVLNLPEVIDKFEVWKWTAAQLASFCIDSRKRKFFCFREIENIEFNSLFDRLRLLCVFKEIDWFSLLEEKLRFFLSVKIKENYHFYLQMKQILLEKHPEIVLYNSGVSNIREGVIIKAINDCRIPSVMMQHGGGSYGLVDSPVIVMRDFEQIPDSYLITWGEGIERYFSNYSKKYNVYIIPAGSSIIRDIFRNNSKEKKQKENTVFYICNNFRKNRNYYPAGLHYTDTWYLRLQIEIIRIFNKYKSYKFIFKVPAGFKSYRLYKKLIKDFEHIQVDDTPLLSIVHNPQLYIIDSLSTAIVQAAATKIPIIAYSGEHCKKPNPDAVFFLKKRAHCCDTAKDFCNSIDAILKDPSCYNADPLNDEFVRQYGIGGSEREVRWEAIFRDIANNRNKPIVEM